MLHYILQTIIFQVFFLLIYDVFLKKETFFNWNRVYLLITVILSIILPFIKIESFKDVVPQEYIISLPEILLGGATATNNANALLNTTVVEQSNTFSIWALMFYLGVAITGCLFLYKLIKIVMLIANNSKHYKGKLTIVTLIKSNAAFSFFRYVFIGDTIKKEEKETILKHEIVHVNQLHSIDLLFFEILRVLFWFNPLIYMYQNKMTTLHEFLADAEAIKHQDKSHYYQNLLSRVFETKKISFINPFFKQSLIKKRIVMLQKSKSKQIHLFKYVLLIPIVLGMLVYTSCEKEDDVNSTATLDLSEYSYSLELGENMTDEKEEIRDKYKAFLTKENPDYVGWIHADSKNGIVYYSVHSVNEKVPDSLSRINTGDLYVEYVSYGKPYFYSTGIEESKKQEEEYDDDIDVPFSVTEKPPVFAECETLETIEEQKKCVSKKIQQHVNKNFNTEIADSLGLKGRMRISTIFKINKEGKVVGVRSRAPHPALEEETVRVINLLPQMKPGMQKGKPVNVPYSLPIIFQVTD